MTGSAGGLSETEKDRVSNWKIAVISAAAALIGAVVGGGFSYLVAVHQSNSQVAEDRSSFLREQRRASYSKLAGDVQANHEYFVNCAAKLNTFGHTVDPAFVLSLQKTTDSIASTVATDAAAVDFIGTAAAQRIAEVLSGDVGQMATSCEEVVTFQLTKLKGIVKAADVKHAVDQLDKAIGHQSLDLENFLEQGRVDLQH